jgi:hypothetical protein
MRVKLLKVKSAPVDKLTIKNWPEGWTGDIDDAIVAEWTEGDDYEAVVAEPAPAPAPAFTPEQHKVLAAAADEIAAVRAAAEVADVVESADATPAVKSKAKKARGK